MKLGILGGGRAAWAYGSAWRRIGWPIDGVWLRAESKSALPELLEAPRKSIEELHADLLLIAVSDTGGGLPPEKVERIFDAFFTTKSQGTGMGLTISRSIVESHGGRLWVAAPSGRGATFQFTLPCEAPVHDAA